MRETLRASEGLPVSPDRRHSRRRLVVCLLAPVVGLALAEVAVRALGLHALELPKTRGSVLQKCEDPIQLFENMQNGKKVFLHSDANGPATRVVARTNAQRFRGPEVALQKPPGVLRVACLGDSHTFGDGIAAGATWPDRLRDLAQPWVEVLNCGVNAYDTLQEVLWYEQRVAPFDPDVVILAYFVNDVAARGLPGTRSSDRLTRWTHPRRGGWIAACRRRSRALDVFCDSVYRSRNLQQRGASWSNRYHDSDPGWQRARDAIRRIQEDCRVSGAQFYVVLVPYVVRDDQGRFLSHAAMRVVSDFCERQGVECFDGEPSIQVLQDDQLRISPLDFHASARVYLHFAAGLSRWLRSRGLPFGKL